MRNKIIEPTKIPLTDNPRSKEPIKIPLKSIDYEVIESSGCGIVLASKISNENNNQNNSQSIQKLETEQTD